LGDKFLNLSLNNLKKLMATYENKEIYSYVLTTVNHKDGTFKQTGTGPNFEGGLITLCTCKHYMRAYKDPKDWEGVWISGLVNKNNKTYLLYIMKVKNAVDNMYDLCKMLPHKTLEIKSANNSIFGDVYTPVKNFISSDDKFDVKNYNKPIKGHKHKKIYQKDIKYPKKRIKRNPALLVGDPQKSFIWTKPTIEICHPDKKMFARGCKHWNINKFFTNLR